MGDVPIKSYKMNTLRSEKHNIYMQTVDKTVFTAYDDKRYYLNNGVDSYPYGHYKIITKQ